MTEGVSSALPQSKPCGFASSLGEGASGDVGKFPFFLRAASCLHPHPALRATFPRPGEGFCCSGKLSGIPISRPLGELSPQATEGGNFPRSAALSQKAALQMPPAVTPPPVKMRLERSAERDKREI